MGDKMKLCTIIHVVCVILYLYIPAARGEDEPANTTTESTPAETSDNVVGIGLRSNEDYLAEFLAEAGVENRAAIDFSVVKNPTIMRFTYGDSDPLGPNQWEELGNALDTENHCGTEYYSPLSIETKKAKMEEASKVGITEDTDKEKLPSLVFRIHPNIEKAQWNFGHPLDTYHGIQISPTQLGSFQVYDDYKSHSAHGKFQSRRYDFTFAQISYCDYSKASKNRSSHRINGKRFPVEVNMLFFGAPTEIGIDLTFKAMGNKPETEENYVMVTFMGKVEGDDNQRWEPIIRAAKAFRGKSFDAAYGMTRLKETFSPSWLLPRNTSYYYYNTGSFPVPPCFPVPRVYVMTRQITISKRQFQILTNIKSVREPSGKLACTVGVLQNKIEPENIYYNPTIIKIVGKDARPRLRAKESIEQEEGNRVDRNHVQKLWLCISVFTIYLANKDSSPQ